MSPAGLVGGQLLAHDQLRDLEGLSGRAIQLLSAPDVGADGYWRPTLSIDCSGTAANAGGIRLRARERFELVVHPDFPFSIPSVTVPHVRWAGIPHVQWRRHLCLFGAPSFEWDPADGMNLLVDRLTRWLEAASAGELDPDDQPLHPPVAYRTQPGSVVIRANLAALAPTTVGGRRELLAPSRATDGNVEAELVVAVAVARRADRLDVVQWMPLSEWLHRWNEAVEPTMPVRACLAVLAPSEATFEYPDRANDVLNIIESLGINRAQLFAAASLVALTNILLKRERALPPAAVADRLHVLIGTPSRRTDDGELHQHLICWRFDEYGDAITADLAFAGSSVESLADAADRAATELSSWLSIANAGWVSVLEDRSEVTVRRDAGTALEWLRGRRIAIFGAGALGGPVAEMCVRAGAAAVDIADNDIVTPGVLVRQPFEDDDIGWNKAMSIAARLSRIRTGVVSGYPYTAQSSYLTSDAAPPFDLIIDATADHGLRCRIERHRCETATRWPPLLTMVVGGDAARGVVTMSASDSPAAGRDLLRRLTLDARSGILSDLNDIADDLFPIEPRTKLFHPEPGCSAPTFIGSAAQMAALAGGLLDAGLQLLVDSETGGAAMAAAAVRIPSAQVGPVTTTVEWARDAVTVDHTSGYSVRVSAAALGTMRAEVRRGRRLRGPKVETGGTLVGQIDDASRCIWVDQVLGPPPDSILSEAFFDHGTAGVDDLLAHHRQLSGRLNTYLGMWHSHPYGQAAPSELDELAMTDLVAPFVGGPRRALILIIGGDADVWRGWLAGDGQPDVFAALLKTGSQPKDKPSRHIGPRGRRRIPTEDRNGLTLWEAGWRPLPPRVRLRRFAFLRRRGRVPAQTR